jgi:hypothetical protein
MTSPTPPAEDRGVAKQPSLQEPEGFKHPLVFTPPPKQVLLETDVGPARRALKDNPKEQAKHTHVHTPEVQ